MAKVKFGNRQAGILCNLPTAERLDLVAEGLPIILASAQGFWAGAQALSDRPREARVLVGFAEEEAAKILILVDLVRCPAKRAARTAGPIIRTYYDHLSRLLYGDAQSWKPVNVAQLREYVDHVRKGHSLAGWAGEHILPNWSRYARESAIYADVELHEGGEAHWNEPQVFDDIGTSLIPIALQLGEAMAAIGLFDRKGLDALSCIWDDVDFTDQESWSDNDALIQQLFARLDAQGLVTGAATSDHIRLLRGSWQMPMYDLDFRELPVSLESLEQERERVLWSEI